MAEEFYNYEWERRKDEYLIKIDFPKNSDLIANAIMN